MKSILTKSILTKSKYCIGPMSKEIVDSIINYSNDEKVYFTFIPSRRQIEWNGGYVNNWTTENFSKYVKSKSKYIAIQRDHGGCGQGLNDDDGFKSLQYDCKYFDSIHLDPWKKYKNFDEGLKWTINMLNYCYNINPNLYYEVGTEEAIRKFTVNELDLFLKKLENNLDLNIWNKILFCVIQSGTSLLGTKNTGIFNLDRMKKMILITEKYNKLSKEHNGDYLDKSNIKIRFNNKLSSINIAPEFGVFQTKIILNKLIEYKDEKNINLFYKLCFESGKWKKWVSKDFNVTNKHKIIEISGHYVFTKLLFLKKYQNIQNIILKKLNDKLTKMNGYINVFYKKEWLEDVIRIHPGRGSQEINNNRLRQHRAERLEPFPELFFNKFLKTINQEDFRYYPNTHDLREILALSLS